MMRRSSEMGGARMLWAMGRAVGAGVKDKMSAAGHGSRTAGKSARVVSVSSPPSTPPPPPPPTPPPSKGSMSCYCDLDEWETIGEDKDGDVVVVTGSGFGFADRCVFGPVPSKEEAEEAVSTFQQIFVPVAFSQISEVEYKSSVDEDVVDKVVTTTDVTPRDYSSELESDCIEPALHLYSSKSSQSCGQENILDAVRLFQINQPFKRMVTALSSDPDVWNAVMKNDVVQELKKSFYKAENSEPHILDEDDDVPKGILRWIMESTKGKVTEFFDMISKLVNDIFHPQAKDKAAEGEPFNDFVRSSFMLSVVVFIIVVMTRVQKA